MYNVEDLRFYKMPILHDPTLRGGQGAHILQLETELTLTEKIAFINHLYDGVADYILALHDRWAQDYPTLKPTASYSWCKRHDPRGIIETRKAARGNYHVFNILHTYNLFRTPIILRKNADGRPYTYTGHHIAHQWFHDLCQELYLQEGRYAILNEPRTLNLARIRELGKQYGTTFDNPTIHGIVWNNEEDVPAEDIERYLNAYERLHLAARQISRELQV